MAVPTFGERLNRLFETVHPPGRGPHSLQEVAKAINDDGAVKISSSYLSQLRNGQKTNPSGAAVAAIARFFRVRTDYFFDNDYADALDKDLENLASLRDAGVRRIATRTFDLSPDSRDTVSSLIESLRRAEGLSGGEPGALPGEAREH